jgi:general secretion pathway protein G
METTCKRRPMPPASWSSKKTRLLNDQGFSLVEMLVVLAILAILAAVTLPYAETTVRRDKELELRRDLRQMRTAIDQFHDDWQSGVLPKLGTGTSDDGFPKNLEVLVEGVEQNGPRPVKKKYLRRVPENPFGDKELPPDQQWGLRSYADQPNSSFWGGQDVYDVYCSGDGKALDGSFYHDW